MKAIPLQRMLILMAVLGPALHPATCRAADAGDAQAGRAYGRVHLEAAFARLQSNLRHSPFGEPVAVESVDGDDFMRADVYGILSQPFALLSRTLRDPAEWCRLACLHPNVKAAVYTEPAAPSDITFYAGRKFFETPEDAESITYQFRVEADTNTYVRVLLFSEHGPQGTRDHRVCVEGLALGPDRCFIRLLYSCRYGLTARSGLALYLMTLGRNKVGFSIVDRKKDGSPVYVKGTRGIVERNAMRYYLAVESHLAAMAAPSDRRWNAALETWWNASMRYREQLYEYEKPEYLRTKQREREERLRLQAEEHTP